MADASAPAAPLKVRDIALEVVRRGAGQPILALHGLQPIDPAARFLDLLGRHAEIIAPSHPGFGNSPRPADFDTVYDLVHLYLDLLESLPHAEGDPARLLVRRLARGGDGRRLLPSHRPADPGRSVRHQAQRPRDTRHRRRVQHQPGCGARAANGTIRRASPPTSTRWDDAALVRYARGRDALCLYGWKPYMYNPQLKRWLARIAVPTLVLWGASDRIVTPQLRPRLCRPDPGRALHADRCRRAIIRRSSNRKRLPTTCPASSAEQHPAATRGPNSQTHTGRNPWTSGGSARSPIPIVPQDVLDAADSVRGSLPNQWCDPKIAADLYRGGARRVPAVRRRRHERAGDRASRRHQLADGRQPDVRRHPGAADAQGAHPQPRHVGIAASTTRCASPRNTPPPM